MNIVEALTNKGVELTFSRAENVERENRGWVTHEVDAIIGDDVVGYIKIAYIPAKEWAEYYPSIFNYMTQIFGISTDLRGEERKGHYSKLSTAKLYGFAKPLLWSLANRELPQDLNREQILAELAGLEKKISVGVYAKLFAKFKLYNLDKPHVAYINVADHMRRKGIGVALYREAAVWMQEQGLKLHASDTQTKDAKAAWAHMLASGMVSEDETGRLFIRL